MFKNGKLKKFKVSTGVLILTIVLTVVCGIVYWFLCYYINNNSENTDLVNVVTIKDIVLVLLTILGTNLLISILVDVYSKNSIISEFFNKDIISSPDFYKRIDKEDREKILNTLELLDHCNNNKILHNMYKSIENKMDGYLKDTYYLETCEYVVHSVEKNNYYEKETLRSMKLKSYEENYDLKKFKLAEVNISEIQGLPSFEINEVSINGRKISNKNIEKIIVDNDDSLEIRNGYNKKIIILLKETLHLSQKKCVQVVINSISRCPLDDKVASFRTTQPCKNFTVNYIAEPKSDYRVIAHAFGFQDCARSYPNCKKDNEVKVGFNDWIFTDDGICITMVKK